MFGRVWTIVALVACPVLAACGRLDFDAVPDATLRTCDARAFCALCESSDITVIRDGQTPDDTLGSALAMRVAEACATNQPIQTVSQNAAGVLDSTTDRPLLPASTLGVMGGGPFFQRAIAYLAMSDAPLYYDVNAGHVMVLDRSGAVVFDILQSALTSSHDVGVLMVVNEPISGARFLSASGWAQQGGMAASNFFSAQIATMLRTTESGWYVFEWQDQDADMNPSGPDTLTIIASGP